MDKRMVKILKPPTVAKMMGISAQSVREHMKRGIWDLGDWIPSEDWRKKDEYNIYPRKLAKLIGCTEEEMLEMLDKLGEAG